MIFRKFGKRKPFVSDVVFINPEVKRISSFGNKKYYAIGGNGYVQDITVKKGKHKAPLVLKVYENVNSQTMQASLDFKVLGVLKRKGYPVPPTFRLVERKGQKFVAMTDLTVFGDMIVKYLPKNNVMHSWFMENLKISIGEKKANLVINNIQKLIEKAKFETGLDISDAFEIVVDTKKKSARAFVVDVDDAVKKRKLQKISKIVK